MRKRILDGFDDGLVEFGLLAFHLDVYLLAATERDIAHGARELCPDIADGLHAGLHNFFLQLGSNQVHALANGMKAGIFPSARKLQQLITCQDQLANQCH